MAAMDSTKRKHNVRSSSSCSSIGSNENGMETGYISDNSTSDVDIVSKSRENEKIVSRKRPRCTSKNAINARLNRERKKKHLHELILQVDSLSKLNSQLKEEKGKDQEVIKKLKEEVKFFKSICVNRREISMLLKCVRQDSILPLSSLNTFADSNKSSQFESGFSGDPFLSSSALRQLSEDDLIEQNITMTSSETVEDSRSVGICLHVAQQHVSLEFCPTCSNNARSSWEDTTG